MSAISEAADATAALALDDANASDSAEVIFQAPSLAMCAISEAAPLSLSDAKAEVALDEGAEDEPDNADAHSDTSGFSDATSLADDEEASLALKEVAEMAMQAYKERRRKARAKEPKPVKESRAVVFSEGEGQKLVREATGCFMFNDPQGKRAPMRVFYYLTASFKADTPLLFVCHGIKRNAEEYLGNWMKLGLAEKHGICILAPEFSDELFPGTEGYNFGGVFRSEDVKAKDLSRPVAPAQWAFNALEGIFDRFRELAQSKVERYFLFGHSAGAQFVHRHLAFIRATPQTEGDAPAQPGARGNVGGGRVQKAVAANAGWYTMPSFEERFPFGFSGAPPLNQDALEGFLAAPLIILLGDRDTDANHPTLNTTARANKQGPHRMARGEAFFAKGKETAASLGVAINWEQAYVPGAAHRNDLMASAAAAMLFGAPVESEGGPAWDEKAAQ